MFATGCQRVGANGISTTCGSMFPNPALPCPAIQTPRQLLSLSRLPRPPESNHELPNEIVISRAAHHLRVGIGGGLRRDPLHASRVRSDGHGAHRSPGDRKSVV